MRGRELHRVERCLVMNYSELSRGFELLAPLALCLVTGVAIAVWSTARRLPIEAALRKREEELLMARDQLETTVAELRRAQEASRESEKRYERAMLASQAGLWDLDVVTGKYFVSPRSIEMSGFPPGTSFSSREDFMQRAPFHPEDLDAWQRAVKELFEDGGSRVSMETRMIPDGKTIWVRLDGLCLRDETGRVVRFAGSATDVTERKLAEAALHEQTERLKLGQAALRMIIMDWNVREDLLTWSGSPEWLRGPMPECGRYPYFSAQVHSEDRDHFLATRKCALETLQGQTTEFRIVRTDGHVIWVLERKHVFAGPDGKATRMLAAMFDITDRKQIEMALRESQDRYALAVAGSDDGVWDVDFSERNVFLSERAQELAGIASAPERTPLSLWLAALPVHPEDGPRHDVAMRDHLAGRTPAYVGELRLRQPDGVYRWRRIRGLCVRDADGNPRRMAGSISDIDARKRAEDALRESENRYERAMLASKAGLWDWDVVSNEFYASPRLLELTGFAPDTVFSGREDFIRRAPFQPQDREKYERAVRELFATGGQQLVMELRFEGDVRWAHLDGMCFRDRTGKLLRWTGSVTDISERKRAEDSLRLSEGLLREAQTLARLGSFTWQVPEGRIAWSDPIYQIFEFEPGSCVTLERIAARLHPDDAPMVHDMVARAREGVGEFEYEHRAVMPDGRTKHVHLMAHRTLNEPNRLEYIGAMQDITQRRHAEEDLRKMEEALHTAQRLEAMGTLAGGISHDFNNILGAVLGYGEMAMRSAKKGSRLHRDLDRIMRAGERGRALVDRILAFSRSGVSDRVPVDVEEVVREALEQIAANCPDHATIAPNLQARRAAMLGDSTQVHQVVMNLVSNGLQAMPQGGVLRVALETMRCDASRTATVGTILRGDYIVLTVNDSGMGIPSEVLERMFDPFFTTKEVGVGSGLGLSLVHGIVTSVGGAIDVTTELGQGSTFRVYLPRSEDAAEALPEQGRTLPRGAGQCVLVVDDEEPLVRLAVETLEHLGYSPVGFTSSAHALREFSANPTRFNAVLTDERMPSVTGSMLVGEVRRIDPTIPVLLMSGYVGGAAALKARELGAIDILKKPLLAHELAASLARALH